MHIRQGIVWLFRSGAYVTIMAVSLWVYGKVRAMGATYGFDFTSTLLSLLILCVLLVPVGGILYFSGRRMWSWRREALVASALAGGVVAGEALILGDEWAFAREVALHRATSPEGYSRQRVWPFSSAHLVYVPGQGIHASD